MNFARKILSKYGWKDGQGLGKNNDGIVKPLKPTLKFDNAGFGADQAAADFNNHWWERVFNEAASNVDVTQKGANIKIKLKDDKDSVEISTKGYSMKNLKKARQSIEKGGKLENSYDFLKAATLTNLGNEVENSDKIVASDIDVLKVKVLTDEELFKACSGRTAHKGARHGLKLSGKLSRIEHQEAELLSKMLEMRNGLCQESSIFQTKNKLEETGKRQDECAKPKQKKKNTELTQKEMITVSDESEKSHKKKKRKHTAEKIYEQVVIKEFKGDKSKKEKQTNVSEVEINSSEIVSNELILTEDLDETGNTKNQKKKRKYKVPVSNDDKTNVIEEIVYKKKKSKNESKYIEY